MFEADHATTNKLKGLQFEKRYFLYNFIWQIWDFRNNNLYKSKLFGITVLYFFGVSWTRFNGIFF